tara:strand:+ start:55 stop:1005 length:951 start_codon:yes stop_codon:yes gene_type:complete
MSLPLDQLIRRLSLRQLQVFLAVYELQGYKKAANSLGLTQPAVSAQIKQLEDTLEQPLFEYVGRKLYRTRAADRLCDCVGNLFAELKHMQIDLNAMQGQLSGDLNLCAVNTAQYVVPHLLKLFKHEFPKINVNLKVVNRAGALERMENNQDDIIIMGMVPTGKPLVSIPFLDNELIPVVPTDSQLGKKDSCTIEAFLSQPLLLREKGSGSRLAFEVYSQEKRIRLAGNMELGSNDAVKHGVLAGLGVAVLPKLSILPELKLGLLKSPDIKGFPLRRSWCLVHPQGKNPSPTATAFLQFVQLNLAVIEKYFKDLELR